MKMTIMEICSGMGILIGIYLFLAHGDATVEVIRQLGTSTNGTIKALQGRN